MVERPKTCVIGAGTSGVICAKVLKQHGVPVVVYEKGSGIGGIWRFDNDNGQSTCYRSLHINTSKRMMELSDFKFRSEIAEYPTHDEIYAEYNRYVDEFGVRDQIQFNTEVKACKRLDDGTWEISVEGPEGVSVEHYDFLCVANGHHWDPRMVDFPGQFDGPQFHAHHYIDTQTPHDLRDKNVVVVGMGNTAMDIACELGHVGQGARNVYLAQRSGVWIVPKVFGNVPQDALARNPMVMPSWKERLIRAVIPRSLRLKMTDRVIEKLLTRNLGSPTRVGLKEPKEPFHMRHPTVSQELHARLIHGDITPKGNIKKLMGHQVMFEDGSVEDVDAIIYATGYNVTFPFFDKDFISAPQNSIPLWQRIFNPEIENLAFIALVQPLCAMMPIAELQSNFVADYLVGEVVLPDKGVMRSEMAAYDTWMKSRFTSSESHTIQIDCSEYSFYLRREWKKSEKRAVRGGVSGSPTPATAIKPV